MSNLPNQATPRYMVVMVKVISWNVNSIGMRLERLGGLLAAERPDYVCLQELKCIDGKFPSDAIKAAGYTASVFGQKTYNGVAVISKEVPDEVFRGMDDGAEDTASRLIGCRFGELTIFSAYIPNGQAVGTDKYAYKLEWLGRARRMFDRRFKKTDRIIIAGDFNVAPEDIDVHDPEAWRGKILFSDPEKSALKNLCSFGFYDTFRKHHKDGKHFSWWDYRMLAFPKNQGLRIDFIYATELLYERCTSARILRDERKGVKPSDHAPIAAEFEI